MTKRLLYRLFSTIVILSWVLGLIAPTPTAAAPAEPEVEAQTEVENGWEPIIQTVTPVNTTGMGPVPSSDPYALTKGEPLANDTGILLPKGALGTAGTESDPALQDTVSALNMPDPIVNFEGGNNTEGVYPPDTDGEVGPNHYVQMVNLHTTIYDKEGNILFGPFTPNLLWPTGDPCRISNDGDPVALYDQLADRWLLSQFALPNFPSGPYYECVAVSKTPVPTNNPNDWWLYTITASTTKMNDYPKLAVWPDAYYVTSNQFTNGSSWGGAGVWAYERDKMLLGQSAQIVYFDLFTANSSFGGMLPVDLDGSILPPEGSPGYFFEVDDSTWIPTVDALRVWEFHVDWTTPANSTFGLSGQPNAVLPVDNFNPLPCTNSGSRSCIPQPSTSVKLDAIGDRLMFRAAYRNFGGHESVVLNHTVHADGTDRAGVRWYEVRDPGGSPVVYQQGTFAPNDGNYRWMASLAMDHVGNIGLGYSVSSGTMFPSIYYTGRLAGDPLGEMPQGEALVMTGTGSQTGTASRWGDYSAMSVDPVDDCTFWYTQEYIQTTGGAPWRTRVASFKFPNCAIGPMGTLEGTVTNAVTGDPIKGAMVEATATITMTGNTTTDDLGHYSLSLVEGTYDVDVSAYGYEPASVSGVVVVQNATTVQDFALDPAVVYTVSGEVYDSTTGWPLYALLQIDGYPGDPIWTDPATGAYTIDLPAGMAFTFNVAAFSAGYNDASVAVGPLTADIVQDFPLDVDEAACSAPGYYLDVTGVNETFSSSALPAGWTIVDNQGNGQVWRFDDPGGRGNLTGGSGGFAIVDSDFYGTAGAQDTSLVSPLLDLTTLTAVNLEFDTDFQWYSGGLNEVADADVSNDGGATWTNVWRKQGASYRGPAHEVVDVTALLAGESDAQIRFHYGPAEYEWWWQVDNAFVGEKDCVPLDGGLVVGTVTDANSTLGLEGATVENDAGYSTLTVPTPGDDTIADGFYTVFSPAGTHVFTATLPSYSTDVASVGVLAGDTVRQDFVLDTGFLTYTPASIEVSIPAGSTTTEIMDLSNTGGGPAVFELKELEGGVIPFGPFDPRPEWVVRSFRQEYPSTAGTGVPPSPTDWEPLAAGDVIDSWTATVPGWGITFDSTNSTVWVSSPAAAWSGVDKMVEYQPDGTPTGREIPHSTAAIPHTNGPADMATNWNTGMMWVMNVNSGVANCIYEVDPDAGYTGNKICPQTSTGFSISQRGLAYDPAGDTYFAGSWNDSTIYRFTPDGTLLGTRVVGLAIAGLAYNPETDHLFVQENGGANNVYVLDVGNNYAQIGTFHIAGITGGAGLEMACDGSLWAMNQGNSMVFLAESGETASLCAGSDVPWLTESPITGTLAAGATIPIVVGFDATTVQPGVYDAQIKIEHDTPYEVPNMPVEMTVTVPPDWGKITGSVESTGYCDAEQYFLADTPVLIETSVGVTYTLTTDENGSYGLWMPIAQSPLTITVNVPDYALGLATGVMLFGQSTTTQDFTLRWLEPCVTTSPATTVVNLALGQQSNRSLRINNLGGEDTAFNLTEEFVSAPQWPVFPQPAVATSSNVQGVTIGDVSLSGNPSAQSGVSVTPPAPERPNAVETLTHSLSQSIMSGNSVSCNASGLHVDNHYLRVFDLASFGITSPFAVTNVEVGIELAAGATGSQPVEVRLYTLEGALVWANLTPIGSANFTVADQSLTIVNVPVTGIAPAGSTLVVDFFTPNGQATGNSLFVGSNNLGQTAPTYLAATECGAAEPTDVASLGFPGMHLVMNVTGNTGGGTAAEVPWISEAPVAGTIASDTYLFSTVTFNANEVPEPGEYKANVVVHSDDPINPTRLLETTMNVSAPANWGVLSGTVQSLGYCEANPVLGVGALVEATGTNAVTRSAYVGVDGTYELWLDSTFSPFTVVFTLPGHLTATFSGITINGVGAVTVQDADLRVTQACVSASPDSIEVTVPWAGSATETMLLENTGASSTPFTITESGGGFTPLAPMLDKDVLLVGSTTSSGYQAFKTALTSLGYTFDEITTTNFGAMSIPDLFTYQVVIYDGFMSTTGAIPTKAMAYMDAGGRFLMADNDLAYTWRNVAAGPTNLLRTYFEAQYDDDYGSDGVINGVDIMAGVSTNISTDPYPDDVTLIGPNATPIFLSTVPGRFYAGARVVRNDYKAIFLLWDYHHAGGSTVGDAIEATILDNALSWLTFSGGDVLPWVDETPKTGTLIADTGLQSVTIDFDASVPEITQPGTYDGVVNVETLDPVASEIDVPVIMHVLPSATQGKLAGTIINLGYCDINPVPLPGATVILQPSTGDPIELDADANGYYSYWFDVASNPITITASAAGWVTDFAVASVTGGVTTTQDVSLRWLQPCGNVDTDAIDVTLEMGISTTVPIVLGNTGAAPMTFGMREKDETFTPTAPNAADVLIIREDVTAGNAMAAALTNLGITSEIVTVAGVPADLSVYAMVAYAGSPSSTTEYNILTSYLDAGGNLLVSDNDFGYYANTSTLYTEYFQADYGTDAGSDGLITGADIMAGIDTDISSDPYPDNFTITGADGVGIFANTSPRTDWAGMKIARNGYKAVYLAWDYYYAGGSTSGDPVETAIMAQVTLYLMPDVAWLSEDPVSGSVAADTGTQLVNVTFDAGVPEITQPGIYNATLAASTNDPVNSVFSIPVTMTVEAPATWGKLEGTVESQGYCDTNPFPIVGADVEVVTSGGYTYTLTTDAAGHYQVWMDVPTNSPVDVTVTVPEHESGAAADVVLTAGATTTQDFSLRWLVSCTSSTPASLEVTLEPGETATEFLTLSNDGGAATFFEISEDEGEFVPLAPSANSGKVAFNEVKIGDLEFSGSAVRATPTSFSLPPLVPAEEMLTHSVSQAVVSGNSVSCNASGLHTDNSYLRRFDLASFGITDGFGVTHVQIGVEQASGVGGDQPVTVNLYTLSGDFVWANLTPIGTADFMVTDQATTIVDFPVSGEAPAGSVLVVELFTPSGQVEGNSFFVGSNSAGQTDFTFLAAPDCGITEPSPTGDIGFPEMHLVMNVFGEIVTSDIPWLAESPITGTISADGTQQIQVDFTPSITQTNGTYTAFLKVANDDPVMGMQPAGMLVVPVTMHIVGSGYGVVATGAPASRFGNPGDVVTYTVTVENTGNIADTYDISAAGLWAATTDVVTVTLDIGETADVVVSVTIPSSGVNGGDFDVTTVTVTSQSDSAISAEVEFTTMVGQWRLWLPLVFR